MNDKEELINLNYEIIRNITLNKEDIKKDDDFTENFYNRKDLSEIKKELIKNNTILIKNND